MNTVNQDVLLFFNQHQKVLPLYEVFAGELHINKDLNKYNK